MSSSRPSSPFLVFAAFFAIYIIWGTTYLANLYGLEGMGPFVLSAIRYAIAAGILCAWSLVRGLRFPKGKDRIVLMISGTLMLVGGSGLVVFGEQYINSGHAAIIIATEPLLFVLLHRRERQSYLKSPMVIAGLIIGFAGLALFAKFTPAAEATGTGENAILIGSVIVVIASLFWVAGTLYAKNKVTGEHSNVAATGLQLAAAAAVSAVIAIPTGEWGAFDPGAVTPRAWGALFFLVIMGSVIAYMAFTWLVRVRPPAIVSTHTYVNPVVAVLIGWLLADEQLVNWQLIALVMVLIGVLMTNLSK